MSKKLAQEKEISDLLLLIEDRSIELEKERKGIEILETYIKEARDQVPKFVIKSGLDDEKENKEEKPEKQEQDMSDIEGDA